MIKLGATNGCMQCRVKFAVICRVESIKSAVGSQRYSDSPYYIDPVSNLFAI